MDKKKILHEFINKHNLAVIATISAEGKPEAAVIEFSKTDNLELVFDTFSSSRKSKNIRRNPNIALVIGWDEDITVQYEGQAFELHRGELDKYKKIYFNKNPRAKKWEKREGITYFKVIPKWIRYSELNVYPWEVFEIEL